MRTMSRANITAHLPYTAVAMLLQPVIPVRRYITWCGRCVSFPASEGMEGKETVGFEVDIRSGACSSSTSRSRSAEFRQFRYSAFTLSAVDARLDRLSLLSDTTFKIFALAE